MVEIRDFTLRKYKILCSIIHDSGAETSTVCNYLRSNGDYQKAIIFRHDVDRSPTQALKMAMLEHRFGIKSTYYFRSNRSVFDPNIIYEISQLGHEIGYHYETLAECSGDYDKAISLFVKELSRFREICPVTTISMHGRPLSRYDNRDLWKKYNFRNYGLVGECYLSIDYNIVLYLSDTGRTWHPTRYNIRDHVNGQAVPELDSTDDLMDFIADSDINRPLCLLTHPNRWTDSSLAWGREWLFDQAANLVKRFLIRVRR